jgi:hypothetical protein
MQDEDLDELYMSRQITFDEYAARSWLRRMSSPDPAWSIVMAGVIPGAILGLIVAILPAHKTLPVIAEAWRGPIAVESAGPEWTSTVIYNGVIPR